MTQFEDDAYRIDMENKRVQEQMKREQLEKEQMKDDSGIRQLNGSPEFYQLLGKMQELHDRKSHDYASNKDPFGNYIFAGQLSKLFDSPHDAGFVGRIGEKLFRLANLENSGKIAKNESVEDTELDICVITTLWMASRVSRRLSKAKLDGLDESYKEKLRNGSWEY